MGKINHSVVDKYIRNIIHRLSSFSIDLVTFVFFFGRLIIQILHVV